MLITPGLFDHVPSFKQLPATPKMPSVQFLGNKERLLDWIFSYAPKSTPYKPISFLDAFSGSGIVAFEAKRRGFRVTANDLLQCCWHIARGLVENSSETLSREEVEYLFSPNPNSGNLMQRLFTGNFFQPEQALVLDTFRANIEQLSETKRSLAFAIMNRALTRKVIMGHFAHLQAIPYANTPIRVKRNPSIAKPIRQLFLDLLPDFNRAVFNSHLSHHSFNTNILDLLNDDANYDIAYFDPPYCMSHSDYQAFYHLLETFSRYWTDKEFIGGTNRYSPPLDSSFDKKTTATQAFNQLFELAQNIPLWLISYNDRSYPSVETFETLLRATGRTVSIYRYRYPNSRGGKGSVKGSHEILFVAKKE